MSISTRSPRCSPAAPPAREIGHRPRVLIVDDERVNREVLRGMLQRRDYDTVLCSTGEEALAQVESDTPDLILLDVVMEPMDGFQVLQRIRQRHPDTELPVIMVTAEADRDTIIAAFRHGANDYVTKPLDPELALARVSLHMRLRQSQLELHRSQERYMLAAQGSQIGLWDWDLANDQLFLSTRWKEMLGLGDEEIEGHHMAWHDRVHVTDQPQFRDLLRTRSPNVRERFECELRMRHRDDTFRWMQCTGIIQCDSAGSPVRMAGSLADITEGKVNDVLTGLPNRLLFDERLEAALRSFSQTGNCFAVLFLDLDKFKLVNDSIGHDAGDLLLCSVARRLEQVVSTHNPDVAALSSAVVARHGGDEFTVLLDGLTDHAQAERIARTIIATLSEPYPLGLQEAAIGCSIGITFSRPGRSSPNDILREADTAMYHAKTSGRGQVRTYDPAMQAVAAARLTLESEVRHALKNGEFYVVYQPIVRLGSGVLYGFEALCRWRHPRGEAIGPDTFIPILESMGLIGELGHYVLDIAGRQVAEWNRMLSLRRPLTVTVNCSTREFAHGNYQRELLQRLVEDNIDPRVIRLEVTESTLMENPESVRQFIGTLRAHGVGVGLDDFGTGYSSLSYLHRLPLDVLKIDKSFVKPLCRNCESYEIVRTIISLANGLDLDVVAEGVETQEQHDILAELGCSHGQGFYFGYPYCADDVSIWLLSASVDPNHRLEDRVRLPAKASEHHPLLMTGQ
ncbi:MAG: putative bifunctional diguanylate cyclase/phosphodiesterase [Planctomycetaceae bacterium]